jgi:hypothetical protein
MVVIEAGQMSLEDYVLVGGRGWCYAVALIGTAVIALSFLPLSSGTDDRWKIAAELSNEDHVLESLIGLLFIWPCGGRSRRPLRSGGDTLMREGGLWFRGARWLWNPVLEGKTGSENLMYEGSPEV